MIAAIQKPILIGEDLRPLQALQQAQKEVFKRIDILKQAYAQLNTGEFNQEAYDTVIVGRIDEIRERYLEEARQTVEKLGIQNKAIRDNMLNGTGELFTPFENACNALRASTYIPTEISGTVPFPLEVIRIENGVPVIRDQEKEAFVEQRCRTYVSTPQEHRAYQKFKELEEAAAGFYTILKEAQVRTSAYDFSELNQLLTKSEEGKVGFKPDVVKWVGSRLK